MGSACFSAKSVQVHPATAVVPEPEVLPAPEAQPQAAAAPSAEPAPKSAPSAPQAPRAQGGAPRKSKPSLIKAVKDGNVAVVEELLREGCDVEQLGMWDNTPLLAACSYGRAEAALVLLRHGVNIRAQNEHGATAMHYAAVEGCLGVVEALIAHARDGGNEALKALVDPGAAKVYNRHLDAYALRTPLGCAAESGFADLAATLLAAGAAVDATGEDGRTPLWLASKQSRQAVATVLLEKGAQARSKDAEGVSVLGAACHSCDESLVLALLAHGVDVNDTEGLPLRDAVRAGKRGAAEALLAHGAVVQPAAREGGVDTPLHAACEKGDEHLVALLVRSRADPACGSTTGQTAFDLLRRRGLADGQIASLLSPPADPGAQPGAEREPAEAGAAEGEPLPSGECTG